MSEERLVQGQCARRSFWAALAELRRAYADEDAGTVFSAFDRAREDSRTFQVLTTLLERVYPVRTFLGLAANAFDRAIAEDGLHEGCRRILEEVKIDWERRARGEDEAIFATAPILFYGNHPSLLTPFLVAAGVNRPDLRIFSTSYVQRLVPSLVPFSYSFEVPLTRSWTEWRRGGLRRVLAYRLLSLLHSVPSAAEAKAANQRGLEQGLAHVRRGGCIMIVPSGGGNRERRWFSGIGVLARGLVDQPGSGVPYVVPIREEYCSNKRIYAHIMRGPIARAKNLLFHRHPVRITFAPPIRLTDVLGDVSTVDETTEALRRHYLSAFRVKR